MLSAHKKSVGPALSLEAAATDPIPDMQASNFDEIICCNRYKPKYLVPVHTARAKELAWLDVLEREALQGYKRSQQDAEIQRREYEVGKDGKISSTPAKVIVEKEHRDGNPAFLRLCGLFSDLRCRIQGSYSPVRAAVEVQSEIKQATDLSALRAAFEKRVLAKHGITPTNGVQALLPAVSKPI